MIKVGLTGGIGSGKSTVASLLQKRGILVVDADQIARDIVEPGEPVLADLANAFGGSIIRPDGALNRAGLAAKAFVDPEKTALLNSITHPRIAEETARRFAAAEEAGEAVVIYDMPLLVDNDLHLGMDLVVVVDVDVEERVRRLNTSRGLGEEDVRRRIAAQIPNNVRNAAADFLINNDGKLADLELQVEELLTVINQKISQG